MVTKIDLFWRLIEPKSLKIAPAASHLNRLGARGFPVTSFWPILGCLWATGRPLLVSLGRPWGSCGLVLGLCGALLTPLGRLLARLGRLLGLPRPLLDLSWPSWLVLGAFGASIARSWTFPGSSSLPLGSSWTPVGFSWVALECFMLLLGRLWASGHIPGFWRPRLG